MGAIREIKKRICEFEKTDKTPANLIIPAVLTILIYLFYHISVIGYKYYNDIDTYHFLYYIDRGVPYDVLTYIASLAGNDLIFLMVYFSTASLFMYLIFSKQEYKNYSIGLYLLASGLVFTHLKPYYIDKDIIIFFLWSCFIMFYYLRLKYYFVPAILMIPIWRGSLGFILIFLFIEFIIIRKYREYNTWIKIILVNLIVMCGVIYYRAVNFIFDPGITETMSIFSMQFFFENVIIAFLIVMGYCFRNKIDKRILIYGLIGFILYACMFRMNLFMLPFIIILFGEVYNALKPIKYFMISLMIINIVFIASTNGYTGTHFMNDNIKHAIDLVNSQNTTCLVNDWGYGNIYQYYTNKTVTYRGHPFEKTINEEIGYLFYGNKTECSIIYKKSDIEYLKYMAYVRNITLPNITATENFNKTCWRLEKKDYICVKTI